MDLISLEEEEKKNAISSKMNHDFRRNRFAETVETFCVRNYESADDKM